MEDGKRRRTERGCVETQPPQFANSAPMESPDPPPSPAMTLRLYAGWVVGCWTMPVV